MQSERIQKIRNFAIIAHIDHGKSTLADRMMEITGNVTERESKDRMLDTLELEQERGITIKMQTARMQFTYSGSDERFVSDDPYIINLVDTPGHVDFSYEVSRSLAAAEGAVLLVDATQGIQAQTLTTVYKAFEYNLDIIPVINKIDLPSANVPMVIRSLSETFGFDEDEIVLTSGKTGAGVTDLLNAIIERVPAPKTGNNEVPRALVYDSFYHEHKGVVALVKVVDGSFSQKDTIVMLGTDTEIEPVEIGFVLPHLVPQNELLTGAIGYIATGLKDIRNVHAGDTVALAGMAQKTEPLPGYMPPKPMVYASLYPIDADDFPQFQEALEKLALNDPAITFQKENSQALGSGFNCGFLGLLHMEITQERLEREFDIDLITTSPSVEYKLKLATHDYSKFETINIANIDSEKKLHIKKRGRVSRSDTD
ncbi:MAG: Elongation factor 4 [candidate division WS6 bacterium OLB20]|uniref:Elongation factor 4 n=1 Tax=candidate division WS6 bacterium OLB20 TaxID=1617426 RepID=A0A136M032_9BACT|nr:MAG: Elongation factor 4 [candidate division WS6 bacterium OLB20]